GVRFPCPFRGIAGHEALWTQNAEERFDHHTADGAEEHAGEHREANDQAEELGEHQWSRGCVVGRMDVEQVAGGGPFLPERPEPTSGLAEREHVYRRERAG